MRLEAFLRTHAQRTPEKTVIVHGSRRVSYRELSTTVTVLAEALKKLGLKANDRLILYLGNEVEFGELLYAAFSIGAIVVPLTTRLTAAELAHIVSDSKPWGLAFHVNQSAVIDSLPGDAVRHRIAIGGHAEAAHAYGALLAPAQNEPIGDVALDQDDALILYTSGTTGRPKGALTTHRNLVTQSYFLNSVHWGLTSDDVFLATTPLAHRFGFSRLSSAICFGATLVITPKFEPEAAIAAAEANRVTVIAAVPTVCRMLLPIIQREPSRLSALRTILTTGEAFPVPLKEALRDNLPHVGLISFFGQTEAGGVTTLAPDEQISHAASVGRPTPGVEVKLVNEAGARVGVDQVGELLVRSGTPGSWTTMRGYFDRPEATAETIVDGWIKTGDLARQDADGYLYIVDRKKDMIISGGYNIYSKEVEVALLTDPGVADAAVIGVPDAVYGEAVLAFIEPRPGAKVTPESVIARCRDLLAGYKKPRHVILRSELPRNSMGKILKNELRRQALAELEAAKAPA
ncbi:AMP-binding protein [Bradyrhizobium sp. Arg237L]|uniref:class I adenylate-forming enzyme family protein n=1 Tax=Bradyrhizobium sp. Arg237L TaxID=3003352 RepID=UPI00249E85C1|nr:AMP-binding protein [Bradyrhizobium sp. Arg237L]MDI4238307.1 AMP-binding protein [Bradyrhizobium sp. Arg237L]